jgi:hypothetical protein
MSILGKVKNVQNFIMSSELLKSILSPFIKKMPLKYKRIIGISSGTLVALSPIIFRFIKKRHWSFYAVLGAAEIFTAFFLQKEQEQTT